MDDKRQKWFILAIGAGATLFVALMMISGVGKVWDRRLKDAYFVDREIERDVVLVAIDDISIKSFGRWPLPRSIYAKTLANLEKAGARVIGLDVTLSEKSSEAEDKVLADQLGKMKVPVVLAGEGKVGVADEVRPLEMFMAGTVKEGKVNIELDDDGVLRRLDYKNSFVSRIRGDDGPEGKILINYSGRPGSFSTLSLAEVWNGEFPAALVRDRVVIIGASAVDLHDSWLTPISGKALMSGMEIHANILQQMEDKRKLREASTTEELLGLALVGGLVTITGLVLRARLAGIADVTAIGIYGYVCFLLFDKGLMLSLLYPTVTVVVVFLAQTLGRYWLVNRQKSQIKRALSLYLSPQVMEEVLEKPEMLHLGGQKRLMTILFSDIAGFTSLSEKIDSERLSVFLNKYLTAMTDIVFENGGVLDKYIGDAVMAFWGAPLMVEDQADRACLTALAMQKAITDQQDNWRREYGVDLAVRIGVNTGQVAVGNMGSETRFDYTVIGDDVNLASRLEGINKQYGTKIVISEAVKERLKGEYVTRQLDRVAVKGKQTGVVIYELMAEGKRHKAKDGEFLEEFEEARRLYEIGKFEKASKLFRKWPEDGPSKTLLSRCEELIKQPPENWDGVYHATAK